MTARAAVVGAGPSGFYAADQLLRAGVAVDLFDALPTPYGLVRAGVAPDHPKIKSVTRMYDKTAQHPGFRFFGGVELGADVTPRGAARALPRGRLRGRHADRQPARDPRRRPPGVGRRHRVRRLVQRPPAARRRGVRPVVRARRRDRQRERGDRRRADAGPRPVELAPTDAADHALAALAAASVTEVVILGRRGPAQATFTNPELRELGELARADVIVDPADRARSAAPVARIRRRLADGAAERGHAARLRGAAPGRALAPDRAALLPLAGRDPRRGARRAGHRRCGWCATDSSGTRRRRPGGGHRRAGGDPLRARDPRRSATAAVRCPGSPSTSAAA